jgi:hypothetical protein
MILTAHIVAGGTVGEAIGNPFIAFFVAILLHFILDAIPHFDDVRDGKEFNFKQYLFSGSDLILSILLLLYLKPDLSIKSPFLWGAIGGVLPDLPNSFPLWGKAFRKTKFGKKYQKIVETVHFLKGKYPPEITISTQVIVVLLFIFVYKFVMGL